MNAENLLIARAAPGIKVFLLLFLQKKKTDP
jgi:hypothetical protein